MAKTPALTVLERAKVAHVVHEYVHDEAVSAETGYGLEAATALGVEAARVFKTLLCQVDRDLVVGIVPVTSRLDLKAVAHAVGAKKATMANPDDAQRVTGYVVGGISPLGQKKRLRTVLDSSATAFETILVSGGRRGLDVELAAADLVTLTGAITSEIAVGS